ncbi:MAG TPA: PAS domain S-box protein [Methanospirillum sp.]|nr:PAS domain S-box protein [Methanospirillum sp.]
MEKIRILFVDDEKSMQDVIRVYLEESGAFHVDTVSSALEALQRISSTPYDVIISDYSMPEMDALVFLNKLRQSGDETPFILFTGKGREELVIEAFEGGADFYLQKGEDPVVQFVRLTERIHQAIDRRRSEKQLRESEERFRRVFETFEDLYYQTDIDGVITMLSPSVLQLSGWTVEELIGKQSSLLYADPLDQHDLRKKLMSLGSVRGYELRLRKRDQTIVWTTVSATLLRDADGTIEGVAGSIRDISDQKRVEQQVRESEERLFDLAENAPVGILSCDTTGRIIFINQWLLSYLRSPGKEETATINLLEYPPLIASGFAGAVRRVLQSDCVEPQEFTYLSKWGKLSHFRVYFSPIHQNGDMTGARIILVDISDQKKAEEAIRKANNKLQLFAGITRHDILNQLMALTGYLNLVEEEEKDPILSSYLDKAIKTAGIIQKQIAFTSEYDQLGLQDPVWTPLCRMIESMDTHELLIHCECSEVSVYADPLIEKVFYNLLDNALRYADGATNITVRCWYTESGLRITWEDDGPGVPDDQKELIFERGIGKNTGLGLFFIREILAITGITISETGVYGKGARFEILVPEGMFRKP